MIRFNSPNRGWSRRDFLLKGASLGVLLDEVAAIAAFMAVAMLVAVATFRKRLG